MLIDKILQYIILLSSVMTLRLPNLQRVKVRMSHYYYIFKMAQKL